ncbi:hypothetical protein [Streptomyces althioticus]|nr:hypothetical protein GA0115238_130013 [Streptomyces sp. di50b]SCE09364.1 hypothetical protein GA0115245_121214 [Streptomyces sp. di188]
MVAVLLNLVFNHLGRGGREAADVTHPMETGEDLTAPTGQAPTAS